MYRASWGRVRVPGGAKLAGVLFGLSLVVWSCYPGEVTNIAQFDIVATIYDTEAPWGTFQSYALVDSVIQVRDEDDPSDTLDLPRVCDTDILSRVVTRMSDLGYSRIIPDTTGGGLPVDTPDVVLLVTGTMNQNWAAWVSYPGWGWYPGWPGGGWWPWWPGWGGWYPCCGSIGTTSYTTGTIFIDMMSPRDTIRVDGDSLISVPWTAAMNGILTEAAGNCTRINIAIDQAYSQSPYLEPN